MGKTKRGKGTKIMAVSDSAGLPVSICAQSATPHEVTLVQETLAEIFVNEPTNVSLVTTPTTLMVWTRN